MRDFIVPSGANYTEFLRDYLKTNTLPNALSDMDEVFDTDFKEEFKQYYLMREIGFDTEELFKQKLNIQCSIMLPYYADKATKLKMIFTNIFENGYSITQTNNLARGVSGSGTRSNTQTNNLAHTEREVHERDNLETNNLTETTNGSSSRDMTNTKNLTETTNDNNTSKHIEYKTPVGMSSDTLPYSSVSGGSTDTNNKVNATRANTGTDVIDEDTSASSTKTNTGTRSNAEDITINKNASDTGTIGNSENSSNTETETNTGTITTLYSKNPRFNSLEALTKFQEDFCNIKLE